MRHFSWVQEGRAHYLAVDFSPLLSFRARVPETCFDQWERGGALNRLVAGAAIGFVALASMVTLAVVLIVPFWLVLLLFGVAMWLVLAGMAVLAVLGLVWLAPLAINRLREYFRR